MEKRTSLKGPAVRFMRLVSLPFLFMVCSAGQVYSKPFSGQEILNKRINVVANQKEIKAILNEISKLAEIKFVYSAQRIPLHKKVSIEAADKKLGEVLDNLLMPLNIYYYVSGNQVVLMKNLDGTNMMIPVKEDFANNLVKYEYVAKPVSGKVINETSDPLSGVSVSVKGTSRGTTTNAGGNFSITVDPGETLEFSAVNFKPYTVTVAGDDNLKIMLISTVSSLEQVVVIGYGTQRRALVTGAVASVSGKTINELPVASVSQGLQGRVAGVQVTNNGSPGTDPIVRIRGISSISYASNPIYVIDGFPTGDLSAIDTRDIESVDVLKDASAAAIYGSRATNGVIMITTKKGKKDSKLHVSLDSYFGTQESTKRLNLLNTEQYVQYATVLTAGTLPERLKPANFNQPVYAGATQTYAQTNTDWQDAYFRTGQMTQHNIGLSGGNNVSRFYASAGYFDQQGIAPSVAYKRFNFRFNSDHQISKVFTFGESLYIASGDQRYDNNEQGSRTNLVNVIRQLPYLPVYDPTSNGGYRGASNLDASDPTNPVEDAELKNPGNRTTTKVLGTAFVEVNVTNWLKFRSTFGVDYANGLDYRFSPIFNDNGNIAGSSATVATITNNRSISTVKLFTEQLSFEKTFGNHHFNAIAVYEQQEQNVKIENISGSQPTNSINVLLNASNIAASTSMEGNYLMSLLGRLNYEYAGKYLLSAAVRRDGLSVWAPGKKYATFPSASVGWRIDQEDFMKSQTKISELKIRAGYGITGLNGTVLGNYPWQVSVNGNNTVYPFNNSNNPAQATLGSSVNKLGNRELEWEKTKQLNIGVDLGLFRNKLTFSAEYFKRNTDNLIIDVPIPPSFGYPTSVVPQNVGKMENNGFELQAGYNERDHNFKWNVSGNFSVINNKVLELTKSVPNIDRGGDQDFGTYNITRTTPGQSVQSFYGWVIDGIFQNAAEVASSPTQTAATAAGDIKFKDISGPNGKPDGKVDELDRTFLGSYLPKFTYAFNAGANYNNFDFSVFFQGVQGNKIFNASRVISEGMVRLFNSSTEVLKAWTPGNTNTTVPRAANADPNQNVRPSARWIEDGSYLRLKNLMIGYSIPASSLQNITKGVISSLRIYLSSQNLLTFTNYSGFDPEVGNRTPGASLTNGIDYGSYPQPRSFQVGLQANF